MSFPEGKVKGSWDLGVRIQKKDFSRSRSHESKPPQERKGGEGPGADPGIQRASQDMVRVQGDAFLIRTLNGDIWGTCDLTVVHHLLS